MTGICWRLVEIVSQMLAPDERDAVRGDLAESGETGGHALRGLLGLLARRQAMQWKDWRRWLVLVGLVIPVAMLLSQISIAEGRLLAQYFGGRWNHGTRITASLVCGSLVLVAWSWGAGFALGSLSRKTIWVNGALFYLVWLFGLLLLVGAPQAAYKELQGGWYRTVFPVTLQTVLFLLPSVWGLHQGLRLGTLRARQTILLAAAMASMIAMETWTASWAGGWPKARLLPLALVTWPTAYVIVNASWLRWRNRTISR
jgi:hypothetical protein